MLDQSISDVPFVFLDTETTGLNPHFGDRILEIALARFRGDAMENYFTALVNPGRSISPGASRIHGIYDADVRDAPRFAEIAPVVLNEINGAVLVAHNAPFDLGFVANELRLARQPCPTVIVLDTLIFLRRYFNFPSNSLPKVAQRLGIETDRFHRALADVLTTRQVFSFIVQQLAPSTLGDLLALQGESVRWPDERQETPLPLPVEEALRLNRKLWLRYVDEFGTLSERWVTPLGVNARRDCMYLRAFCYLRNAERNFRLDRVLEMRVEA